MKYFYTWQEFDRDIEKIAEWARDKNFKSIYGIPRGGLVVAVVLSHRLDLPINTNAEEIDQKTLITDNISDSGGTLENFEKTIFRADSRHALLSQKYRPNAGFRAA